MKEIRLSYYDLTVLRIKGSIVAGTKDSHEAYRVVISDFEKQSPDVHANTKGGS